MNLIRNQETLKHLNRIATAWLAARQVNADEYRHGLVIPAMNKYYPGGWNGFCLGHLSVA